MQISMEKVSTERLHERGVEEVALELLRLQRCAHDHNLKILALPQHLYDKIQYF